VAEDEVAAGIVEALAGAWTVFNLYPEPESQPSFHRLGESVRENATSGDVWLDVGPGFFLRGDQEVEVTRDAASRLAQRCYIHNIASIGVTGPPSDRDIAALMSVLSLDEATIAQRGGISALLMREGVGGIAVVTRVPLATETEGPIFGRPDEVAEVIAITDPTRFAEDLIEEAGGDPDKLAELFHGRYRVTYGLADESDVVARERVVFAFVEAFFAMDEHYRVAALRPFLESHDDPLDRLFLDQFAGHELARIAPKLDSQGFALLMDYARIGTDDADRRPEELLGWLGTGEGTADALQVVTARVQERLEGHAEGVELQTAHAILRTQLPDPRRHFYHTLDTFRGLLSVEDRNDRFRRLMRLMTGKIVANVRHGKFRHAELWVRSVMDSPTYPPERVREVEEALELACTAEVIDALVTEVAGTGAETAGRLATKLTRMKMDVALELLAEETDRSRRKALIGILGEAAELDPGPVLEALDDERWYVVRNLAIVLRASGNKEAVPSLARLTEHKDHRVRVEALRALAAADPSAVSQVGRALGDEHEVVRRAAVGLLAARQGAEAEALMLGALGGKLTTGEKEDIIRHLGDRGTPEAAGELERIAGRRFVLSGRGRVLRAAAREALAGRS
jgi:hypothetical protein